MMEMIAGGLLFILTTLIAFGIWRAISSFISERDEIDDDSTGVPRV